MTLPEGAALGTTTDPQTLIKGEPGQVEANAARLGDEAARIGRLADQVDAVAVDGWEGGVGQPAYAAARRAEQGKWRAYARLLERAGASLSTYAGALRAAQGRAADAIARWEEGEQATEAAVREYSEAVAAYNAHANRRVSLASTGPVRPAPFVDPGEPLRREARQILEEARKALDAAGATAVKELGGLPGARTEGSSGQSASGGVDRPSFDWQGWENTFGKNPADGAITVGGSGGLAVGAGGKFGGEITPDPRRARRDRGRPRRRDRRPLLMTATLPVPVRFELPDGSWAPVPPESLGVRNAAFLAVRRNLPGDYKPTITISGDWRNDDATLEQIADESLEKLRGEGATEVELLKRRVVGSEHAPAVMQSIGALARINGRSYDLRQAQVVMGLVDAHDASRRVVVIFTLTSTYAQFEAMGGEFEQFMATVEVVPEGGASGDA